MRCSLLILTLMWSVPVAARQAADSTVHLRGIEVVGERTSLSRTHRIDLAQVGGAESNIGSLLDRYSGLFLRRYGAGGTAVATMRGIPATHTVVRLDGLPLSDPQSGQIDLSTLPTVFLEAVEVVRGAASGAALGGEVRLHSFRPKPGHGARVRLGGASWGARRAGALYAFGRNGRSIVVAGEMSDYSGAFPIHGVAGSPGHRDGAGRSMQTLFGQASQRFGRHTVRGSLWASETDRGVPGPSNSAPRDALQQDRWFRAGVGLDRTGSRLIVRNDFVLQHHSTSFVDRTAQTSTPLDARSIDFHSEVYALPSSGWMPRASVNVGADYTTAVTERRVRVAVSAERQIGAGHVASVAGLGMQDGGSKRRTAWTATISTVQTIGSGVSVHASAGRAGRFPSIVERFWVPGGNPDLRVEHGWSADAGLAWAASGITIEAGPFLSVLNDRIVWQPGLFSPGLQIWRPNNIGRVRSVGVEASATTRLSAGAWWLQSRFDGSFTSAVDRTDSRAASFNRQLRYLPRASGSLHVSAGRSRWDAAATLRFAGRRAVTSDETLFEPGYVLLDARVSMQAPIGRYRVRTTLTVDNVFDRQYAIIRLYPMPIRSIGLHLVLSTND